MSDAFDSIISAMEAKFAKLRTNLLAALQKKPETSESSTDATSFAGTNSTALINEAKLVATNHIATSNAHGVTREDLGGVGVAAVNDAFVRIIPEGVLPIARYGDFTDADIPVSFSNFVLRLTAAVPAAMAGYVRPVPAADLNLAAVTPSPADKTFYIYLKWNGTVMSYMASLVEMVETDSRMQIGTVTTGASAITAVNLNKVSRLDNYRVTVTPSGSSIPATGNNPSVGSTLPPAWLS